MLDFIKIKEKSTKIGLEIYPAFIIKSSFDDLMIRGGDFYAVWNDYTQLWSTDEGVLINLIDSELEQYAKTMKRERVQSLLAFVICGIQIQGALIDGINIVRSNCETIIIR